MKDSNVQIIWLDHYLGNPATHQLGHLVVNDCVVPRIEVRRSLDLAEDGCVSLLHVENLHSIDTTENELDRWGWFLANAMGAEAGFGWIGGDRTPRYARQAMHIDSIETTDEGDADAR